VYQYYLRPGMRQLAVAHTGYFVVPWFLLTPDQNFISTFKSPILSEREEQVQTKNSVYAEI
jgi:hypothetical protein